jgi:hypothetical protein
VASLGGEVRREDPLRLVSDAIRRQAPVDVCMIIDDVQGIEADSAAGRFLADLVRGLPSTAHLVLAGRRLPDLPLARLSANRMLAHCLVLAGRAAEAAELADRTLRDVGDGHTRLMPSLTRWYAGDPTGLTDLRSKDVQASGARDAFVESAIGTVIRCCTGDAGPAEDALEAKEATAEEAAAALDGWGGNREFDPLPGNSRDAALATNAADARWEPDGIRIYTIPADTGRFEVVFLVQALD